MAVSCFICTAVSFCSLLISSIIFVVVLVAMALAAVYWISLRLVVSLLLLPMDLSSWLSCSKAFTYASMASYSSVESPSAAVSGAFSRGGLSFSLKAAANLYPARCAARSAALVTTPYSLTKCFTVLVHFFCHFLPTSPSPSRQGYRPSKCTKQVASLYRRQ